MGNHSHEKIALQKIQAQQSNTLNRTYCLERLGISEQTLADIHDARFVTIDSKDRVRLTKAGLKVIGA